MNNLDLNDFDAVIFDMDGILIDSEPLWKIVMEKVFESVGCIITRKDFEKTVAWVAEGKHAEAVAILSAIAQASPADAGVAHYLQKAQASPKQ